MKKTFLILAIAFTAVSANAQFLFRISGKKMNIKEDIDSSEIYTKKTKANY